MPVGAHNRKVRRPAHVRLGTVSGSDEEDDRWDVSFGTIWEAIDRDLQDAVWLILGTGEGLHCAEWTEPAARLAAALSAGGCRDGGTGAWLPVHGAPYLENVFARR